MIKNHLKFNNLGILTEPDLKPVSQGNHNVDYYYIAYDVYDYTNSYVTVSSTLPNGDAFPELPTSFADFEFNGSNYQGFMFKLPRELTSIAGTLTITINLTSVENDARLCSSRVPIEIHKTNVSTEPTITELQYNQMLETMRDNYNSLNEKIEELKLRLK